jgi:hypothetical protein
MRKTLGAFGRAVVNAGYQDDLHDFGTFTRLTRSHQLPLLVPQKREDPGRMTPASRSIAGVMAGSLSTSGPISLTR